MHQVREVQRRNLQNRDDRQDNECDGENRKLLLGGGTCDVVRDRPEYDGDDHNPDQRERHAGERCMSDFEIVKGAEVRRPEQID